jgi:oligosaccharide repeat unit polymerase
MEFYASLSCIFLLTLLNFFIAQRNKNNISFGYPPFLFCSIWLLILTLHALFSVTYMRALYPLSTDVLLVIVLGAVVATATALIHRFVLIYFPSQKSLAVSSSIFFTKPAFYFRSVISIVAIILLPLYLRKLLSIAADGITDNLLFNIRYELAINETSIGVLAYAQVIAIFAVAIQYHAYLHTKNRITLYSLIVSAIIALVYVFFSSGRGYYLFLLAIFVGLQIAAKQVSKKFFLIVAILFLTAFIGVGSLLNKISPDNNNGGSFVSASMFAIGLYTVVPLNAFDYEMTQKAVKKDEGLNSFRFVYALAEKSGIKISANEKAKDLVQEFVFVPYPCNVYTFYSPYYRDFGMIYAYTMLFVFLLFHAFLYTNSSYNHLAALGYAFLLFPLLFSFFQDQYLTLLSTWIQISLLLVLYYFIAKYFAPQHD